MIKAKGERVVFLGLSDENIKQLQEDKPIKFNLKDLGLQDLDVVIFNGRTEDSMRETLKPLMAADSTIITRHKR